MASPHLHPWRICQLRSPTKSTLEVRRHLGRHQNHCVQGHIVQRICCCCCCCCCFYWLLFLFVVVVVVVVFICCCFYLLLLLFLFVFICCCCCCCCCCCRCCCCCFLLVNKKRYSLNSIHAITMYAPALQPRNTCAQYAHPIIILFFLILFFMY